MKSLTTILAQVIIPLNELRLKLNPVLYKSTSAVNLQVDQTALLLLANSVDSAPVNIVLPRSLETTQRLLRSGSFVHKNFMTTLDPATTIPNGQKLSPSHTIQLLRLQMDLRAGQTALLLQVRLVLLELLLLIQSSVMLPSHLRLEKDVLKSQMKMLVLVIIHQSVPKASPSRRAQRSRSLLDHQADLMASLSQGKLALQGHL